MIGKETILPAITTTKGSDWRAKIKEADELGLDMVALFPTCLDAAGRQELYGLLDKSKIKKIPFVHLRSDMEPKELDFLIKNYKTKIFNTHCRAQHPHIFDLSKYKDKICLENVYHVFEKNEMDNFAGICLDLSHLENDRILYSQRYDKFCEIISNSVIGCNHISAIQKKDRFDKELKEYRIAFHFMEDFSELDYLKNYPRKYFSNYIALELENDLKTQLEAKDYIFDLLKDCW